jgi:ferredoxin
MVVRTQNGRTASLRKGVMELYISDHPLDCLTCSANGDCELQDMAGASACARCATAMTARTTSRLAMEGYAKLDEGYNPYFTFDPSKCIVCSRCVRACEEVQGTFALTITGRGFDSKSRPGRTDFLEFGVRLLRRLRAGLPDGDAVGEEQGDRARPARAFRSRPAPIAASAARSRPRCSGDERRPHGALQGRQGEPRPLLRQGPLRLGLCDPSPTA